MKHTEIDKPCSHSTFSEKLTALKPNSRSCIVLETAAEYRTYSGVLTSLNKKGLKFATKSGENGTINIWRVK